MVARIVEELGPWAWWVVGLALLALEVVVPGVFLVWFGLAAILTGSLALLFWNAAFFEWHIQLLLFALFSVATVLSGRRWMSGKGAGDQPLLNRRSEGLVGRTAVLEEPIAEGVGRVRLGDTLWRVEGPDLPAGARVRVVAAFDSRLRVDAA
ncbi:NfeD family protein [Rhizobium sp. CC-YZS058]|uniref:NfeD family protein n=1 Tax=Rhizobium sp. CC-YZS058 TaxID=3042153 RepID=UPI002B05D00A|nr:NfeD family protein [Rhizobium sp. CC-YZS058]MEA3533602.1 NfeD family protein [Rhizobium sp. CC-YZS058]